LGRPRSRRGSFHWRRSTVGARSTAETSRVEDVPPHPRSTRNLQPATFASHPSPLASSPLASRRAPYAKTLEVGTSSEQAWILPPATFDGWRQIHGGDFKGPGRSTSPTFNAQPATCNLRLSPLASRLISSRLSPRALRQDPRGWDVLGAGVDPSTGDVRRLAPDPRRRLQGSGTFHLTHVQRATCNLQPATCNLQPATCNLQPATCNLQPATFASSLITPPPVPPASHLWRPARRRRRAGAG
jgi:hypothetical protein